jgi:hypothetical protein
LNEAPAFPLLPIPAHEPQLLLSQEACAFCMIMVLAFINGLCALTGAAVFLLNPHYCPLLSGGPSPPSQRMPLLFPLLSQTPPSRIAHPRDSSPAGFRPLGTRLRPPYIGHYARPSRIRSPIRDPSGPSKGRGPASATSGILTTRGVAVDYSEFAHPSRKAIRILVVRLSLAHSFRAVPIPNQSGVLRRFPGPSQEIDPRLGGGFLKIGMGEELAG